MRPIQYAQHCPICDNRISTYVDMIVGIKIESDLSISEMVMYHDTCYFATDTHTRYNWYGSLHHTYERFFLNRANALKHKIWQSHGWTEVNEALVLLPKSNVRKTVHNHAYQLSGVYIIQSGNYYRIGMSSNVPNRIKQLIHGQEPSRKHLHTIWTENYRALEKALHECFSESRVNFEWFALSDEDVVYLLSL